MTRSILFVCNMNSVRSPMAAALLQGFAGDRIIVDSAGVHEGWLDPFVEAVMQEEGVSVEDHEPKPMATLDMSKFDLVIALTEQSALTARKFLDRDRIELWDIANPSEERGGREEVLAAYRAVREELKQRIAARFGDFAEKP